MSPLQIALLHWIFCFESAQGFTPRGDVGGSGGGGPGGSVALLDAGAEPSLIEPDPTIPPVEGVGDSEAPPAAPSESVSVVWYLGAFGGLVAFFVLVTCTEWCWGGGRGGRGGMSGGKPSPPTPPPPYHLFAPPPYPTTTATGDPPYGGPGGSGLSSKKEQMAAVYVVPLDASYGGHQAAPTVEA